MVVNIQEANILGTPCTKLHVVVSNVELDVAAEATYSLGYVTTSGEQNEIESVTYTTSGMVHITGNDYAQWGNDDSYIVELVASKIGVTIV